MNEGTNKVKLGKTTERVQVEVERDVALLKDTKSFISQLIKERGLYEPDVLKRASIDGGDKSLKLILNVFDKHQDPEITFPRLERKGNLCSGVNRSIVLAYCEDLEENYENVHRIIEMLWFDELDFIITADFKLLNV